MKTKTKFLAYFGFAISTLCLVSGNDKTYAAYDIHVTTGGPQEITVQGDRENAVVSSDSINVTTTCRSGYNFVISTSVNDNNLYLDGDTTNNASGSYFSPADGVASLSNTTNTWGYYYDEANTPTASSVFSAVPTLGSSAVIKSPLETPSETDIDDNFNIYYGVSVSSSMKSGIYKMKKDSDQNDGAIVYQATIADACMRYTVNFNATDTYSGSAVSGTGTMASQSIYEGVATNLSSNTFVAPSGYSFVGWNTAQDGTGTMYANGASVTDLASAGESITLYAMWSDCPAGNICYRINGTSVSGTMANQTGITDNASTILRASNFSRSGYGFAGWSDKADATVSGANIYGPMETITAPSNISVRGLNLYSIWIASAGSLQDTDDVDALCGTSGSLLTPADAAINGQKLASVSALTDQRDNQTYAIARLADGKCWMIENLRLDNQYTTGNNQTDPTVTNESLSQGYNASFAGLAVPESADFSDSTTANSLYSTDGSTTKTISGDLLGYRFPRYNNNNTFNRATDADGSGNTYSYGNYYTWHAVIADTTNYTDGTHNTTSICPTGWHVPSGNTNGEYYVLNNNVNAGSASVSTGLRSYPTNFLYSGHFHNSSADYRNSLGFYWSSTLHDGILNSGGAISILILGTTYTSGTAELGAYYGASARCIAGQ